MHRLLLPRRGGLRRLSTAAEAALSPSPHPPPRLPQEDSLFHRLAAVGNPRLPLSPVLEQWSFAESRPVDKLDLQSIIKYLTRRRRFSHALEVSMWMTDRRHLELSPDDVASRLELIAKVHGPESAVSYFGTVPSQLKLQHGYCALLKCHAEAGNAVKAEELFGKMWDIRMVNAYSYNIMMNLYLDAGDVERVRAMYRAMEESGVRPNVFSIDVLVLAHAAVGDVEGIEKVLEKVNSRTNLMSWHTYTTIAKVFVKAGMQEKALQALQESEKRINPRNGRVGYGLLMSIYADLGMHGEVDRIWDVCRSNVPASACNSSYMCRMSVLIKMDDIDGAEKAFEEWESRHVYDDNRIINILVDAYCTKGLLDKAETFIDGSIKKGRTPYANTWYKLADGYFKDGQVLKAVDLTRKALATATYGWKPNMTNVLMSLNHFKEQKNVEAAEEMASLIQRLVPLTRDVYHGLLKTYVNAGQPVSDLLDRMRRDGVEADEETDRILAGEVH